MYDDARTSFAAAASDDECSSGRMSRLCARKRDVYIPACSRVLFEMGTAAVALLGRIVYRVFHNFLSKAHEGAEESE